MTKRRMLIATRLFFGALALAAVTIQAIYLQQLGILDPFNYLGYFTNLSNILAGIVLIIAALYLAKKRKPSPREDLIRGAATLYIAITGLVYVTLLSGEDLGLLMPWVNTVTHIIVPVYVIVDWLYQPQRTKLHTRQILLWLIWPALYVTYTLIRGSLTGWYPYPFLNPQKVNGYGEVAVYCVIILAAFFICGWLLMKLGNTLKRNVK